MLVTSLANFRRELDTRKGRETRPTRLRNVKLALL